MVDRDDYDWRFRRIPAGRIFPGMRAMGMFGDDNRNRQNNDPSCPCYCVCGPLQFRWGYQFQFGDLTLCLHDNNRNPISPFRVTYTMYQTVGQATMQMGPADVTAVKQDVGLYYAVGTAGENGQPGDWVIQWACQQFFNGPVTTTEYQFQVVDVISSPIPRDPTCRTVKYGWDP